MTDEIIPVTEDEMKGFLFSFGLLPLNRLNKVTKLWKGLEWKYRQRAYHNLQHLGECLAVFEKIFGKDFTTDQKKIIQVAIIIHDLTEDNQAHIGVLRSAAHAEEVGIKVLGLTLERAELVGKLIKATDHTLERYQILQKLGKGKGWVERACLAIHDIDLWILAAPLERFKEYELGVRNEYRQVSVREYQKGRLKVMKGLLANPLYLTKKCFSLYEGKARKNLAGYR
jgi:predicted metal-dependent HD superfamily phosphohydrolase